jgi:RNA polymerase sigma factor (sigma-70 family)
MTMTNLVVEEHYIFAQKISEHYCNRIGIDFTEDICAEGLVGLVKASNCHQTNLLSFKSWAAFKIRCEIREWIKSQFRGQKGEARSQATILPLENCSNEFAVDGLENVVCNKDQIYKLLECIPANWREVICLHYMEGYTFKKIGEKLGYSKNNASSIHMRALGKMKDSIEKGINYGKKY